MGLQDLRPRPAQAFERLQRAPRSFALGPCGIAANRDQRAGRTLEHFGHGRVILGRRQAQRLGQPARRRHAEARGVDEGEGLQQIEARQVRVSQPARHQRRVEQQHGRIGGGHDCIALGHRLRCAVWCPLPHLTQPMPAMAGVKRGERKRSRQGHRRIIGRGPQRCKRRAPRLCPAGCPTPAASGRRRAWAGGRTKFCAALPCPSAFGNASNAMANNDIPESRQADRVSALSALPAPLCLQACAPSLIAPPL